MARKFIQKVTDDLDGSPIPEGEDSEMFFGLDNANYAIDLSQKNADALRESLAPYIAVARHAGRTTDRPGAKRRRSTKAEMDDIRRWARDNGYEVSDRGRVPQTVTRAYKEAKASA